jgi:uncharacterized protein YfeS
MRYFLEFREHFNESWRKSVNQKLKPENQEDGFESLGDLLDAIADRKHIPADMTDYRIVKEPEQPEKEVLQ